ncbi:MAG: alpha/beta hydrolase [Lachnospiraceae bacterium]
MNKNGVPLIDQSFLGKKGQFYVGGKYAGQEGKHYVCNQMFVEAYIPKEILHPYPVVMFHGAGQTNMNWLITPDGRMGWADHFVSKGYCVYLAEQPARGRSAYHAAENGSLTCMSVENVIERFTSCDGPWPQAKKHNQWPGNGANCDDEVLRQFLGSQVQYLASNKDTQELVLNAGAELLELIGPAILLTHSQSGPFGWLLADAKAELVKGIVALEPQGPPFSSNLSMPTAEKYGPAELPLRFEPPVTYLEDFELELKQKESPEQKDGWVMKEPARKLPNLKGISIIIIVAEASYHAGYDHLTSRVLLQSGVKHDFVRLEDCGIHGNGHMMMLEKNNIEIADYIIDWLTQKIK